jgi:hypothetical protein
MPAILASSLQPLRTDASRVVVFYACALMVLIGSKLMYGTATQV